MESLHEPTHRYSSFHMYVGTNTTQHNETNHTTHTPSPLLRPVHLTEPQPSPFPSWFEHDMITIISPGRKVRRCATAFVPGALARLNPGRFELALFGYAFGSVRSIVSAMVVDSIFPIWEEGETDLVRWGWIDGKASLDWLGLGDRPGRGVARMGIDGLDLRDHG